MLRVRETAIVRHRCTTFLLLMKGAIRHVLLVSTLVLASLAKAGFVQAQTEKTVQRQHDPTPYISHAEFQSSSVGGEPVSRKSSGSQPTFRDILTVASLDEVTRRFGEPTSTEYNRFPGGSSTDYVATLAYEWVRIGVQKDKRGSKASDDGDYVRTSVFRGRRGETPARDEHRLPQHRDAERNSR